MPLYDYKCWACGQVREHRHKVSDDPLTECPDCGGEYRRVIRSVGIIFKGSGFHVTDYRAGSRGRDGESKKDKSADKAADSKGKTNEASPAEGGGTSESPAPSGDQGPRPSSKSTQDQRVA